MPFGIPASKEVAAAAGNYAGAAEYEVSELVAQLVQPIGAQIEAIETALGIYSKAIGRALKKSTGGIGREVADISDSIGDMVGYISQETSQYVAQLSALASAPAGGGTTEAAVSTTGDTVPGNTGAAAGGQTQAEALGLPKPPEKCFSLPPPSAATPVPLPTAPRLATTFPCPQAPADWQGNRGVTGSVDWCKSTEQILDWLDGVGAQILAWLTANITPSEWAKRLGDLVPHTNDTGVFDGAKNTIHEILSWIGQFAGNTVLTLVDIIKCASYYTQILTPVRRPAAYIALLIIRNILRWIQSIRLGTQSYGGFTISTVLLMPQLEVFLDSLLDYMCNTTVPTYPDAVEAYVRGYVERPQFECLLRLNGLDPSLYMPFAAARGEQLSVREAIQYDRRFGVPRDTLSRYLRKAGVIDEETQAQLVQLYDEVPSISDHLNWLRKGIFIPGYVERYNLDSGFTDFYAGEIKHDLHSLGYTEYRAKRDYEAHWIQPDPSQLREFVYRLRPKGIEGETVFTVEDYKRILVEQEYAPIAREWLAQTVYHVPALGYLRDMYRSGVIDDKEIGGYHADLGYSPDDSARFVQLDSKLKARQNARMGSGWSPSAIRRAVSIGAMPEGDVGALLEAQGFGAETAAQLISRAKSDLQYRVLSRSLSTELSQSVSVVRQSQSAGIMSESDAADSLTALGYPAVRAASVAALNTAAGRIARIKGAVSRIRHAFESGEVDIDYARQALLSLKLVQDAIDDYLAVWTIEMTPRRKRLSAQAIVAELAAGTISQADAHVRLANLGYDDADQSLLIADAARQTVTTPEALAQLALEPTVRSGPGLAQLGDTLIGLSRKVVAQLKSQEPPSKLGKWLKHGIVDSGYVSHRLRLYGWDQASIEKWIQEYGGETEEETPEGGPDEVPAS